ncbi:hypothetical protein MKK58_26125 [Methylobacterium sp. J-078]|uniref:hypothetical protein n=1 Tax=Methylobacterium sp. J-078 TaxID=2836657 RepID=UPI001FBBD274|nr:hypothetical protein [Methylobacterium sp. J-078]MCJ2047989.1 hypothetical protein [Methylobacterium sp. J-078]
MKKLMILIQNYHEPATQALVRDFKKIGFEVISPDSDWGKISYYAPNQNIGSKLVSYEEFLILSPNYVMIACKPQESDFKKLANDVKAKIILNIAQQHHEYEPNISDIMICPDIGLFNSYSSYVKHKLLYFPFPYLDNIVPKDLHNSYRNKIARSYISFPKYWPIGTKYLEEFRGLYSGNFEMYGHETINGVLSHSDCHEKMSESFFTVHFKEAEAYGLSCLESMLLGTPVITLDHLMKQTTLGKFFLDNTTSVSASSVKEAIDKIDNMSFEDYSQMSVNCSNRVKELTADSKTVDVLRKIIHV